jgi:predicted component of type VI protein secretion system
MRAVALRTVLEVKITEATKGAVRTVTFSESPVRIGRNQLNDISLDDPFVSEWHGIIRFDDAGVAYFDLGSTNGSALGGKRLPKNVAVAIPDGALVSLGRIDISIAARRDDVGGPARTIMGLAPVPAGAGSAPPDASHAFPRASVARTPPPVTRLDEPITPPPTPVPAASSPSARASRPAPDDDGRSVKILQAFSEAFVGLKKGYEQFGSEVGVRTINGMTALHKARTSREVLDHLLNPAVDAGAAVHDLIAIFADFGIHHIAMMEAVTEGVRSVLHSLDPRANGLEVASGIWGKGRNKELFRDYVERFEQVLTDDNQLHAVIFGDDFARAYASVTLGEEGGGQGQGGKSGGKAGGKPSGKASGKASGKGR